MPAVAQVKKEDLATKNTASPGAETSVTVNGKNIWIYYHAPSVRGRHIFGGAGAHQPDGSVWRLGADYATVLHTDADLDLNGLAIPKGDYTLYADLDNGQPTSTSMASPFPRATTPCTPTSTTASGS